MLIIPNKRQEKRIKGEGKKTTTTKLKKNRVKRKKFQLHNDCVLCFPCELVREEKNEVKVGG